MSETKERADYTYWQNALKGDFGPIHEGDAQLGFFRKRTRRAGPFVPVAIFMHEGQIVALCDGHQVDAAEIWSYVCQHPVAEEWYHTRINTGKWPDESEAVSQSLAPPPAGHNNPPEDEAEILKGQIDAATAGVAEYAEIGDDETASKAQSLRSRLLELSRDADKKRETEKKPHLEAGKSIDAKFQPLVKAAKAAADTIAKALGEHETRKARAAEAARLEAERKRREAEAAARSAEESGKPAPPPPPVTEPEPMPAPTTSIKGAYGRAASVKVAKVATVTDIDAAFGFLKTHKELVELISALAQRAVNAGYDVPGVTVKEKRKVS